MKIETYIDSLVSYAMNTGLADPLDHQVLTNRLLDILRLSLLDRLEGNLIDQTYAERCDQRDAKQHHNHIFQ